MKLSEQKHTDECLAYQANAGLAFCNCDCFSQEQMSEIPDHEIANSAQWWKEEHDRLQVENEALSELLSPLVDVELERDKLKETIDSLIAVYDLTQRDVENALKKWGGKEQDDET